MKKFTPPQLFKYLFVTSALLSYFTSFGMNYGSIGAGLVIILAGLWMNWKADRLFKQMHTTIKPWLQPTALVTQCPFSFSRNPMYLGMALVILAPGVILLTPVSVLFALAFAMYIAKNYIPLEEDNMTAQFATEYLEYKAKVRRWI